MINEKKREDVLKKKSKARTRKGIIKIRAKINKIKTRKAIKKIKKDKSCSLKISKLANLYLH